MTRISAIDIGTNTILLLIADIDNNGTIHCIEHRQQFPRIGKNLDKSGYIHTSIFKRVAQILNEYKNISIQYKAKKIIASASSAIRDAVNKKEFLSYIFSNTGIDIEVLTGEEEALWTYLGALSGLPRTNQQSMVIDIGGGSTEISFPQQKQMCGDLHIKCFSLQIGSVRITERYFRNNPPSHDELELAERDILDEFSKTTNINSSNYQLVGVAGTVTTLACLDQELIEFDIGKVSGYQLSYSKVKFWLEKLSSMDSKKIQSLSNTTQGRADILTAGVLILHSFMKFFHFDTITTSERGLRYGLVLREWKKMTNEQFT